RQAASRLDGRRHTRGPRPVIQTERNASRRPADLQATACSRRAARAAPRCSSAEAELFLALERPRQRLFGVVDHRQILALVRVDLEPLALVVGQLRLIEDRLYRALGDA